MKKAKILKTIQQKEDKIIDSIEELKEFLYLIEDEEISSMTEELYDSLIDNLLDNDNYSLNTIREFLEEDYE